MSRVERLKVMPLLNHDVLEQVDILLTAGEVKPVSVNTHIFDQIKEHALQTPSDRATRPCIRIVQRFSTPLFSKRRSGFTREASSSLPQPRSYVAKFDEEEARQLFGIRETNSRKLS